MCVFVEMCHKILKKVIKCSKIFAIFKVPFQKFTQYLFLAKSNIMDGIGVTSYGALGHVPPWSLDM